MNRVSASPLARARLTLHQRIILAIILDLSNTGGQHVDRKRIYGEYAKVYAKLNLAEPTIGEVVDTISALVSNSMIAVPQKPKNVISMLVDPDTGRSTSQAQNVMLYFSEGSDLEWRLRQHDPLCVGNGLEASISSVLGIILTVIAFCCTPTVLFRVKKHFTLCFIYVLYSDSRPNSSLPLLRLSLAIFLP